MALEALLSLFSMLPAPSLEDKLLAATLAHPFLRHATTYVSCRLQAVVWLPIVMSWRAMTTISVSDPARSGIGVAHG